MSLAQAVKELYNEFTQELNKLENNNNQTTTKAKKQIAKKKKEIIDRYQVRIYLLITFKHVLITEDKFISDYDKKMSFLIKKKEITQDEELSNLLTQLCLMELRDCQSYFIKHIEMALLLGADCNKASTMVRAISQQEEKKISKTIEEQLRINQSYTIIKLFQSPQSDMMIVSASIRDLIDLAIRENQVDVLNRILEKSKIIKKNDELIVHAAMSLLYYEKINDEDKLSFFGYLLKYKQNLSSSININVTVTLDIYNIVPTVFHVALQMACEPVVSLLLNRSSPSPLEVKFSEEPNRKKNEILDPDITEQKENISRLFSSDQTIGPLAYLAIFYVHHNLSEENFIKMFNVVYDSSPALYEEEVKRVFDFLIYSHKFNLISYLVLEKKIEHDFSEYKAYLYNTNQNPSISLHIAGYIILEYSQHLKLAEFLLAKFFANDKRNKLVLSEAIDLGVSKNASILLQYFDPYEIDSILEDSVLGKVEPPFLELLLNFQTRFPDVRKKQILSATEQAIIDKQPELLRPLLNYLDPFEEDKVLELAIEKEIDRQLIAEILSTKTCFPDIKSNCLAKQIKLAIRSEDEHLIDLFIMHLLNIDGSSSSISPEQETEYKQILALHGLFEEDIAAYILKALIEAEQYMLLEILLKSGLSSNSLLKDVMNLTVTSTKQQTLTSTSLLAYVAYIGKLTPLRLLIQYGASPKRLSDKEHLSPLIFAAMRGWSEIVEALVEAGADVTEKSNLEPFAPPIYYALSGRKNNQQDMDNTVKILNDKIALLENKKPAICPNMLNDIKKVSNIELIENLYLWLVDYYSPELPKDLTFETTCINDLVIWNRCDRLNILSRILTRMLDNHKIATNFEIPPNFGSLLLSFVLHRFAIHHLAIELGKKGNLNITKHIIKNFIPEPFYQRLQEINNNNNDELAIRSDLKIQLEEILLTLLNNFTFKIANTFTDTYGNQFSPLLIAAMTNSHHLLKLLIDKNVRVISSFDNYAVSLAARYGNLDILHLLIPAGARTFEVNYEGLTALDCAVQSNNKDVVDFLMEKLPESTLSYELQQKILKNAYKQIGESTHLEIRDIISKYLEPSLLSKLQQQWADKSPIPIQPVSADKVYSNYNPDQEFLFDFFTEHKQHCLVKIGRKSLESFADNGKQFVNNMEFNNSIGFFGYRIVPVNKNKHKGFEYKMRLKGDRRLFFRPVSEKRKVKNNEGSAMPTYEVYEQPKHPK